MSRSAAGIAARNKTGVSMSPRILTITLNPTVDVSGETELLRPVHKVRTTPLTYEPGGGGINVAGVISNLGGDVDSLYVGGGATGTLLTELLIDRPYKSIYIPNTAPVRLSFNMFERTSGFEYRFVPDGEPISTDAIDNCLDAIAAFNGSYVVASGSVPLGAPKDLLVRMAEIVNEKGARFILDTSGPFLSYTLEHADVFLAKPSLSELRHLAGDTLNEASAREAAMTVIGRGRCEMLAITLGAEGAMLADKSELLRLPALHVVTKSTVGAGDSFLGAMVWALSENWDRQKAFKLGIAAGAAAAMTPGTQLCKRDDVMRLFETLA
jgi:6-phosphofructokinase 2